MIEPFIIRAIIAGVGVAIIAGAIGCFVVWRKMAYFGDSLAHSALLGVALGLAVGISTNIGTIIICSIFTITLIWLQQKKILATDTLLGILAHSALSVGMVTLSLLERSIDLHSYLFENHLNIHVQVFGSIVSMDIGNAIGTLLSGLLRNMEIIIGTPQTSVISHKGFSPRTPDQSWGQKPNTNPRTTMKPQS